MPVTVERLSIEDVLLVTPERFSDSRGYFVEIYTRRGFAGLGIDVDFLQDNQSLSAKRGTVRGLHFQIAPTPQAKLVRVLAGAVFDVAVDLRAGSPTYGRWCGATLTAAVGEQIFIPVGFAHGFCTLEPDTIVAYKMDGYYDHSAERGLRWNDPGIGIDWPLTEAEATLSDKDAGQPLLRDASTPFAFRG